MQKIKSLFVISLIVSIFLISGCKKEDKLKLSGTIEAKHYDVVSEVTGSVLKIEKSDGEKVKSGDLIIKVDSKMDKLNYDKQQILLDLKKSQYNETKDILTDSKKEQLELDIKQQEKTLEQAGDLVAKYDIKSVNAGTLLYNTINKGELIKAGSTAATIINLDDLWVNMYVPQKYLSKIKLNDSVDLQSSSNEKVKGKVVYISDEAEFTPKNIETNEAKESTVFKIKISIDKSVHNLKPGMILTFNLGI